MDTLGVKNKRTGYGQLLVHCETEAGNLLGSILADCRKHVQLLTIIQSLTGEYVRSRLGKALMPYPHQDRHTGRLHQQQNTGQQSSAVTRATAPTRPTHLCRF